MQCHRLRAASIEHCSVTATVCPERNPHPHTIHRNSWGANRHVQHRVLCQSQPHVHSTGKSSWAPVYPSPHPLQRLAVMLVPFVMLCCAPSSQAAIMLESDENLQNIPSQLGQGEDGSQKLSNLLSGEKKGQVEGCVRKCVPTCVRGGGNGGAPGLGPISLRREIVVFKDGFRSRSYCLSECANVCSLSINGPSSQARPAPLP